jgi:hypothetical protein
VLEFLEKHDKDIKVVNRIDVIMEKFKGKESLLLEKMTQMRILLGPIGG